MKAIISPRPTAPPRPFPPCSCSWGLSSFHITKNTARMNAIPARDLVIDFGKHKGKMLGMLSSEYLRWMSNNLKTARDFEKWGKLAEEVLGDEVYKDRMEWEVAERLLSGEGMEGSGCGVATELEETSKRFGWDYNDKVGWSKVDFRLLGTSKGGRLPRKKQRDEDNSFRKPAGKGYGGGGGVGRKERRERAAKKREHSAAVNRNESNEEEEMNHNVNDNGRKEEEDKMGRLRFPGRQSLLNRALNRHNH